MSNRTELIKEWIHKAKHDIGMAELALENRPEYTDSICFHCQQTVEKYLKAYLVFLDIRFERKHRLVYLLDLINEKEEIPDEIYEMAEQLEDYAIGIRYPDDWLEPTLEEAKKLYKITKRLEEFIFNKIKKGAINSI